MGGNAFGQFQRIGHALMLPVSILPAAGILIAVGLKFKLSILEQAGGIIFTNLALIFAVGVAIGLAKNEGTAGLAAVVGYLVMNTTLGEMGKLFGLRITEDVLGIPTIPMGVFGGIIIGLLAAGLYNRFHRIELPSYLGFFGGQRFVPIITAVASFFLGVVFFYVWPFVQSGINHISHLVLDYNTAVAAFIYGTIERALIPFGLHHIFYAPFWFEFGSYTDAAGEVIRGDLNRFMVGDPTAGTFLTGKFPFMMFGLPFAALAIYHESKPEKKKMVGGIMLSAALTSFLTGITEPIEFSFLFVAPLLFATHCIFAGSSYMVMDLLGAKAGATFSGGIIDLFMFWEKDTSPWMVFPVGVVFAVIYYFGFRFAIRKWNLKTPGREEEEQESQGVDNTLKDLSVSILKALGGKENIIQIDACITRLRVSVVEPEGVDKNSLKRLGSSGVLGMGSHFQVVFGTRSDLIKEQIRGLMEGVAVMEENSLGVDLDQIESFVEMSEFVSPMAGELIPITSVDDSVFSAKMMGDGFAICPVEGVVVSPVDGVVVSVFLTKHAVGIYSEEGYEILIHVGINTVTLEGIGFTSYVSDGDKVVKGQKLLEVDFDYIKEKGLSSCTPVVFTNLKSNQSIVLCKGDALRGEEDILLIKE